MGVDRENPFVVSQHGFLVRRLRSELVNLRTADGFRSVSGGVVPLGDQLVFSRAKFEKLRPHEQRLLEALAIGWSNRSGILIGRSAARVCGMWVVPLGDEKIEVALPSRSASPSRRASTSVQFRYSPIPAEHISEVQGIRVTVLVRTFADIARYHGFLEGLVAIDCLRFRGIELSVVAEHLRPMGRFKGVATVRRCIHHSVAISDSPFESLARGLLIDACVTGIQTQVKIEGYRVDLLVDGWLVVEIDGASKYSGADAERVRQSEFNRQKTIANLGYVFLRYSPADLLRDPAAFVAEVTSTLANRRSR
ncbi:hypothetical protein HMPREF0298_2247 [Corynebacterium lipophiloflavum DSM 44291]|uniref:Restriction endonuclease type II-like domain-containing protein n=2 Tax=Corynebacterium lipophiloflavum TaxID=161889 RepID=C0XUX7_CORLD|nr:hypothetical protein HMPREF0298_2247 [Corynebacterium lipophiloflavum DSM 44291]